MKKSILLALLISLVDAKPITLSPQQSQDWHIQTATPKRSKTLAIGEFIAEVTTPPQLLHTISLPFEAQIKKLSVATYDDIKKGQLLAEVTGRDWIELQKQFISDAIELKHHGHIAERKNKLCQEEIIPQKECTAANAEYRADTIKVSASKALLRGYGASETIINDLFDKLKITQTLQVRADVSGKLLQLNVRSGKRTNPSDALFVIQKKGALWLEVEMLAKKAMRLADGQRVKIHFNHGVFESKILLHAPMINVENQTQGVRFALPNSPKFLSGMRDTAQIFVHKETLKVTKKSIISDGSEDILFLQTPKGFESMAVTILGEDEAYYYLEDHPKLHAPIAISSIAILKSLMEESDE